MRRSRGSSPSSSYRALAHHAGAGQQGPDSVSSLIRSFNVETNPTRPMRPSPLTASTIADMPLELVDRIRSFPLFMSAPDAFLAAIGKHLRIQVHSAHDHILTEGDDARAMYWLVRGVVAVTSRDGEAVYAELKPGAFFGEIGVLMDVPRTATIVARSKCMLAVLKKEDLQAELPHFPDMEQAIRQEAQERLTILKKKQQERGSGSQAVEPKSSRARAAAPGEVSTGERGAISDGAVVKSKKRKSPSPGVIEDPAIGGSALGSGYFNVRRTLKELPLFSTLPSDILHFLGLSAQPKTYPPFTDIVEQGGLGNDIYFIVRGEAEVIREDAVEPEQPIPQRTASPSGVRPRLSPGQYFGEVASLGLSQGRTATVRSITTVECLMIGGDSLDELWRRCPPELRRQIEETAKTRYRKSDDGDLEMKDVDERIPIEVKRPSTPLRRQSLPQVIFTTPSKPASPAKEESETRQPSDPDPFLSVDMENLRTRRRNSLAPPTPQSESSSPPSLNGSRSYSIDSSPLKFLAFPPPTPTDDGDEAGPNKKPRILPSRPRTATSQAPPLPDDILVGIFRHLDILELIRLRSVSRHWRRLLSESPKLCTHVNLSPLNRKISDWSLINIVAPFLGTRPVEMDISNCFHVGDDGFQALWKRCGQNVRVWRMKSVWEVSAGQILDMADNAKELEEIDWSNCRKVGDNLLARVVGWVVPEPAPGPPAKNVVISSSAARKGAKASHLKKQQQPTAAATAAAAAAGPAPGTVIGCPKLKRLNLSYCKHITDRSMAHLAAHASQRLESLSLTRCTSITDAGFQAWAPHPFARLRRLCLADCTYLGDAAIVALVNAAKDLTHLDLSFCCALSDTATEVVALGLRGLVELRMAFCGSAVSDASLGCVALHLEELRGLSVRGCVRVTGRGVEGVLEGCGGLGWVDVSQCKNLGGWLREGEVGRWGVLEGRDGAGGGGAGGGGGGMDGGDTGDGDGRTGTGMGMGMRRGAVGGRGGRGGRAREPVRFIVEKGDTGLR